MSRKVIAVSKENVNLRLVISVNDKEALETKEAPGARQTVRVAPKKSSP